MTASTTTYSVMSRSSTRGRRLRSAREQRRGLLLALKRMTQLGSKGGMAIPKFTVGRRSTRKRYDTADVRGLAAPYVTIAGRGMLKRWISSLAARAFFCSGGLALALLAPATHYD
jgi:hypothetical protein